MPIASTSPNSESVLNDTPTSDITRKVPTRLTGIAMIGMIAARQVCRKTMTTITTRMTASISVLMTSLTDS